MPAPRRTQELVQRLEQFFLSYLVAEPKAHLVLALWSVATHVFDVFDAFPYLAITSPTKRCGKTRAGELLELACAKPLPTVGITPAALFRSITRDKPTLITDEAESLSAKTDKAEALREVLNAGYRKGKKVRRCASQTYQLEDFEIYCPKVLILIGNLPDTLADRCIPIRMRRKTTEPLSRFRLERVRREVLPLGRRIAKLAREHRRQIKQWYLDHELEWLEDREAELWLPLFAVCTTLWTDRLPDLECIARELSASKAASDPTDMGVKLLADTRQAFTQSRSKGMPTAALLSALQSISESPWVGWSRGKGLDARGLARLLKPFGISPQNIRHNGNVVKGYEPADFEDAWSRYVPQENVSSRYTATRRMNVGESGVAASATSPLRSGPQNKTRASNDAGCSAVADNRRTLGFRLRPPV